MQVSLGLKQLASASSWLYAVWGHTALTGNCWGAAAGWWGPSFFTLALQLMVTHLGKHKARSIFRLEIWVKLWCHQVSVALGQGPEQLIDVRSGTPSHFTSDWNLAQRVAVLHSKGQTRLLSCAFCRCFCSESHRHKAAELVFASVGLRMLT